MRIVGVDPGIKGGVCFLNDKKIRAAIKMPTYSYVVGQGKKKKDKNMVDAYVLGELIRNFNPDYLFIEKVGAMPNQGVVSMFSFGMGTGMVYGICGGLNIKVKDVRPQDWKEIILDGTDKDKDAAVNFCKHNFPDVDLKATPRSKNDHDGIADSICIACFGLYHINNNTEDKK